MSNHEISVPQYTEHPTPRVRSPLRVDQGAKKPATGCTQTHFQSIGFTGHIFVLASVGHGHYSQVVNDVCASC